MRRPHIAETYGAGKTTHKKRQLFPDAQNMIRNLSST
jgi:hypothetical protein